MCVGTFRSVTYQGLASILLIMNNAIMNLCVKVFMWTYAFNLLECIPTSGFSGLLGNSTFSFLRKGQSIF